MALVLPAAAAAAPLPAETVAARKHFFGAQNVDASGNVPRDKVIMSWFSVSSYAAAMDGHVVLLDTYIHKGEDRPGYVPTTTAEVTALKPEAIFIGHGHFDHAATAGSIAARTGAPIIGTPEHCDGIRAQAGAGSAVKCVAAVDRGSAPGAQVRTLDPFGGRLRVTVLKHVHSAAEPPDGENHESSITAPSAPDEILLHPPGPSLVGGLSASGEEGSSLLYQFRVGSFSLVWHDSSGPLRELAPQVFGVLRALPPTDVEFGAALGFNDPTNGMRDPVDYMTTLNPKIFYPGHHDFVAEYGASKGLEGVFRREMAKRHPVPSTEVRWMYDPVDYLRPHVATFDVDDPRFGGGVRCLSRRSPIGARNIGRIRLGYTGRRLLRLPVRPVSRTARAYSYCVNGGKGRVSAVLSRRGRVVLVTTTAPSHGNRGVRPGARARAVRRAYPRRRAFGRGLYRANARSPRLVGTRRGRVRYLAVADRRLLVRPATLRRYLRLVPGLHSRSAVH